MKRKEKGRIDENVILWFGFVTKRTENKGIVNRVYKGCCMGMKE